MAPVIAVAPGPQRDGMRTFALFFVFIVFLWVVAAIYLLFWRSHELWVRSGRSRNQASPNDQEW